MLLIGILPGLGQASIIPKDGSVVITKFSLLHILSDGVALFFGGDLHFGLGHFGDFNDGIEGSLGGSIEGNVVPGGDGGVTLAECEAEGFGVGFSLDGGGVRVEDGGGDGAVVRAKGDRGAGCAPCRGGGGGGEGQESEG